MRKSGLLLTLFLSLSMSFQASAGLKAKKYLFYGVALSNAGITLLRSGHDIETTIHSWSTISHRSILGDPPNVVFNDSPVNFLSIMLDSEIGELIREDNLRFGSDVKRELYISAAGYDAAIKQLMNEPLRAGATETTRSKLESALSKSYLNQKLDLKDAHGKKQSLEEALNDFGCFEEANKGDFHACGIRWNFKYRTGMEFSPENTVIEQDMHALGALAEIYGKDHQFPSWLITMQATTITQPFAYHNSKVVNAAGWMDQDSIRSLAYSGGTFEEGTLYNEAQASKETAPEELNTAMGIYLRTIVPIRGAYLFAKKEQSPEEITTLMKQGKQRNNSGMIITEIADPNSHFNNSNPTSNTELLATAQQQAAKIVSQVRDKGVMSLAIYLGLYEPALDAGAGIVIVDKYAQLMAEWHGESVADVLYDILSDDEKSDNLFRIYNHLIDAEILTDQKMKAFDLTNPAPREKGQFNLSMGKKKFRQWLSNLAYKVEGNVHYIAEEENAAYYKKAYRSQFRMNRESLN